MAGLKLYFELSQVKCERYQQPLFLVCLFNHSNVFHLVVFASYVFYSSRMCCLHVNEFILRFYFLCFCGVFFSPTTSSKSSAPLVFFKWHSSRLFFFFFFFKIWRVSFVFIMLEQWGCWWDRSPPNNLFYNLVCLWYHNFWCWLGFWGHKEKKAILTYGNQNEQNSGDPASCFVSYCAVARRRAC